MTLEQRSDIAAALLDARAAPLSRRRAMLAVLLVDRAVDGLCPPGGDLLAFRADLAARHPALALLMALAALEPEGPALLLETVEVPLEDYPALGVADFMVSLYNAHTVQRVRVALPDGTRRDVHELLEAAAAELQALGG